MGTMVPLPATAGHPVSAVAASADRVAALCDGTVYLGSLQGGLSALCEGAVDVAVHGSHVYTGRDNAVVVVDADSGGAKRSMLTIDDVDRIPWLAHVDLDAWPGPEDAAVSALSRYDVELAAPVERAIRGLRRDDVRAHAEEIGARVRASTNIPYDSDEDPWHPPAAAVDTAVYVAETLAGYVALGWPVPDDLQTLCAWYEAGRWPGAVSDRTLVVY